MSTLPIRCSPVCFLTTTLSLCQFEYLATLSQPSSARVWTLSVYRIVQVAIVQQSVALAYGRQVVQEVGWQLGAGSI